MLAGKATEAPVLAFEVTQLPAPAYLVRVENEHGENVCAFNVTIEGSSRLVRFIVRALCALAAWLSRFPETLVLEGLRGAVPSPAQWRAAMAEHFPSAERVRFERGSAVLETVTDHRLKVRTARMS